MTNKIKNMTIDELMEIATNPIGKGLTFGDYAQILDVIERANKLSDSNYSIVEEELCSLRKRVFELEIQMSKICRAFNCFQEGDDC